MSSVRRDVVLHHEPLENPAELGVPLFVPTQVGCEVVERPHGSADVGKGESREQLAIWDLFRRKRDGYRQDARPNPGLSGGDPERRATADGVELRLGDGNVAEKKARRLAAHHAEIGQVGGGVAHQEVVDVVLSWIDAGCERRPGRGRLWRMRRRERTDGAGGGQPREVGKLARLHPPIQQARIHAIEAENQQLGTNDITRRSGTAGRGDHAGRQRERTQQHARKIVEHR